MKIGPKVALDDTIADTKFQGSVYTGSSGKADTRIVLDQFSTVPSVPKVITTFLHIKMNILKQKLDCP